MRLNVTDRIELTIKSTPAIHEAIDKFWEYIMTSTLTERLIELLPDGTVRVREKV